MKFNGPNHVYKCIPPVLGNEVDKNPVILHLKIVTTAENSHFDRETSLLADKYDAGKASEMIQEKALELIASKVVRIEGLEVDGKPVENFEAFWNVAPPEFVTWVNNAIYSTQILTAAEIKN